MKTTSNPFAAALLTAALAFPAMAVEAPEDNAPPPPAAPRDAAALPEIKLPEAGAANEKQAAFLGIVSSEVPDLLAEHLGLKTGEGVLVRSLVPGGPAATSGLAKHDVIVKVGGQAIGSPAEISNRVSSFKPGDKVTVETIHQGKPASVDVTLGIKPAEMANAEPHTLDQLDLQGMPKELADRLRDALEGNIGGMDLDDEDAPHLPQMDQAMRDLQKRMQGAVAGGILGAPGGDAKVEVQSGATVKMQDQQGSVEVRAKNDAKEVTIRDQAGNVTWTGPWDTAQDRAAAPADVRQRVEALNIDSTFKGGGLRLQMRPAPPDH